MISVYFYAQITKTFFLKKHIYAAFEKYENVLRGTVIEPGEWQTCNCWMSLSHWSGEYQLHSPTIHLGLTSA
jgi:hypothetical protein